MAKRALRPCSAPGCGELVDAGQRFCDAHRHRADQRPSAARRGYGHRWRKLRAMVLKREPFCRTCAAEGRVVRATDVDHITPRRDGGRDELTNLQPLCKSCHSKKTAVQSSGWATREGRS